MNYIGQTIKKSEEADRFRDQDVTHEATGLTVRGAARQYYEKTAVIRGLEVSYRHVAEGPDAISLALFEARAAHRFDNIYRIIFGIPPITRKTLVGIEGVMEFPGLDN